MITLAPRNGLLFPVAEYGIYALKQASQMDTYGTDSPILEVWTQKDDGGLMTAVVSRLSGWFTISAKEQAFSLACAEELREFMLRTGGIGWEGEASLLRRILVPGDLTAKERIRTGPILELPALQDGQALHPTYPRPILPDSGPVEAADSLAGVYKLLCKCDREFKENINYDYWLTEFSHKCRHDLASCFVVKSGKTIAATASILFRGPGGAIMGLAACDPEYRGHGLGAHLLNYACKEALAREEKPWLLAANEDLGDYYKRLGWRFTGTWAMFSTSLKETKGEGSNR